MTVDDGELGLRTFNPPPFCPNVHWQASPIFKDGFPEKKRDISMTLHPNCP